MGVKNINTDSSTNVSYGRIAMLATNNDFNLQVSDPFFNRLSHQTGMVFSLDTQKPEIKCFSGYNVDVCTNMCVFGNANVLTLQLKDGLDKSYSQMKEFFSVAEETMTNHQNVINTLTNNYYSYKDLEAFIGKALFYATANSHLGTTPVLKAVKLLSDKSSKYALDHKQGGTGWLIYNAFTEALKDSSVSDEPTKVALLENLFLS
jgi:hypothetical protein